MAWLRGRPLLVSILASLPPRGVWQCRVQDVAVVASVTDGLSCTEAEVRAAVPELRGRGFDVHCTRTRGLMRWRPDLGQREMVEALFDELTGDGHATGRGAAADCDGG